MLNFIHCGALRIANTKAVCVCAPDNYISSAGNGEKNAQKILCSNLLPRFITVPSV